MNCRTFDRNTYGGGCFLINNDCKCYSFDTDDRETSSNVNRKTSINDKQCSIDLVRRVSDEGTYSYQHIIPLDVGAITCKNTVATVPYAENYKLSLSNYISADFGLKNLEISIISNYNLFSLDGNQLNANNRFKILNELTFYLAESKKISVGFRNYGIFITGTKDCSFNIRVCHPRCSNCYDSDANDNNHQCTQCRTGFYLVEDIPNCKTIDEMKGTNYYLDSATQIFKKCYADCKTCSNGGNSNDMKCDSCYDSTKKYLAEPNNCISDITS